MWITKNLVDVLSDSQFKFKLDLLIFREGGRAFGDCFATLDSKPKTMDGHRVSALCVNLGHGSGHKVDGGETARAQQVVLVI